MQESVESFGSYLRRERELREITLEEIAAYTRIKFRALEAIEKDDFASLPPIAFVRAFIRCYSDYIGLNVPDVMLRFDAYVQNKYPELTGEVPIIKKKPRPRQRYVPLALAVLVILVISLYFWYTRSPVPGPSTPPESENSGMETPAPVPEPLPATSSALKLDAPGHDHSEPAVENVNTPDESGEEAASTAAVDLPPDHDSGETAHEAPGLVFSTHDEPLGPPIELATIPGAPEDETYTVIQPAAACLVTMTVKQPCWIEYLIDNADPRQTILQPDQTVTFKAVSKVRINIGNPDGVESISLEGEPVNFQPKCSPWWFGCPAIPEDEQPCLQTRNR